MQKVGHHAKCEGMVEQTWRDKSDRLAGWLAHARFQRRSSPDCLQSNRVRKVQDSVPRTEARLGAGFSR